MLADVQSRRIALAQIAPRLGSLDVNLATHHGLLDTAREEAIDTGVASGPRSWDDFLPVTGGSER